MIWNAAARVFPFFDKRSLDWNVAFREHLDRVVNTKNDLEFYLELTAFAALLKDGHTGVTIPKQLREERGKLPFQLLPIGGKYYVGAIRKSKRELLLSEITYLNGRRIEDVLNDLKRYVHCSDGHFYRGKAEGFLPLLLPKTGNVLDTVDGQFAFSLGNAEEMMKVQTLISVYSGEIIVEQPQLTMTRYEKGIVLVKLDSFLNIQQCELVKEKLLEQKGLQGVIFDIRENIGGMTMAGALLAGLFHKGEFSACQKKTRKETGIAAASASQLLRMDDAEIESLITRGFSTREEIQQELRVNRRCEFEMYTDTFNGSGELEGLPCVLLTSRDTFSAAEDFTAMFKSNAMGKIVGQPTYGSTGTPMLISLSGGASARVCSVAYCLLDGTEFINRGIQPDVFLEPTIAQVRNQRDVVLDRALEHLMK